MRRLFLVFILLLIQYVAVIDAHSDVPEYRELWRLPSGCVESAFSVTVEFDFDSTGEYLAAMTSVEDDCVIAIWNIQSGQIERSFLVEGDADTLQIHVVEWSFDDRYIAVGQNFDPLLIYDSIIGELSYVVDEGSYPTIDWNPTQNLLTLWNGVFSVELGYKTPLEDSDVSWTSGDYYAPLTFAGYWSPDGTMVALPALYEQSYMPIFTSSGELLDVYRGYGEIAWSPDSTRLAISSQIREVSTGRATTIMPLMRGIIRWHPHADWVLSTEDNFIYFWDVTTGEQITLIEVESCNSINGLEISPTGRYIAAHCYFSDQSMQIPRQERIIILESVQ